MNTLEVEKILRCISFFGGTFPRDIIPQTSSRPVAYVVNTDPQSSAGEHWLGILLLPGGEGEYFDPFGFPPLHPQLNAHLTKNCPQGYEYNSRTIQDPESSSCGLFVIDFIASRSKGQSFQKFLSHYSTDLEENESLLRARLREWLK